MTSRSPIIWPDGCILRTFGDIAPNARSYVFDMRRHNKVCRSEGCHIDSPASSSCQLSPNISGIVGVNSLRCHNVEYMSRIGTYRIAGSRMEHCLSHAFVLMLSQLIPGKTMEDGQESFAFALYERPVLSYG